MRRLMWSIISRFSPNNSRGHPWIDMKLAPQVRASIRGWPEHWNRNDGPAHARVHQRRAGVLGFDGHALFLMQGEGGTQYNHGMQFVEIHGGWHFLNDRG